MPILVGRQTKHSRRQGKIGAPAVCSLWIAVILVLPFGRAFLLDVTMHRGMIPSSSSAAAAAARLAPDNRNAWYELSSSSSSLVSKIWTNQDLFDRDEEVSVSLASSATTQATTTDNTTDTKEKVPMDTPARQSLPSHLQLQAFPGKGLGVVTLQPIARGTVVGDYQGEVLTRAEKDRRYLSSQEHLQLPTDVQWKESRRQRGQSVTGTYLYGVVVPNQPDDAMIYIDAEDEYCSLWTRFLNHASDPNVHPKSIHESWNGKPRVWFVASRDIAVGEELCFDYGDDYWLPEDRVV